MMMRRQYPWRHEDRCNDGKQEGRCVGIGLSPFFNVGTGQPTGGAAGGPRCAGLTGRKKEGVYCAWKNQVVFVSMSMATKQGFSRRVWVKKEGEVHTIRLCAV